MYRCFTCKFLHDTTIQLIRHLKLPHGFYPGKKFSLICAQDRCSLQFGSFAGFRKHLKNTHGDERITSRNDLITQMPTVPDVSDIPLQTGLSDATQSELFEEP